MDLIILVLALALIGCIVYLITTKIPMDATVKLIIQIIVVIVLALFLLRFLPIPNVLPGH